MGVPHGCLNVGVAHPIHDEPKVHTSLHQPCCTGVSEGVEHHIVKAEDTTGAFEATKQARVGHPKDAAIVI